MVGCKTEQGFRPSHRSSGILLRQRKAAGLCCLHGQYQLLYDELFRANGHVAHRAALLQLVCASWHSAFWMWQGYLCVRHRWKATTGFPDVEKASSGYSEQLGCSWRGHWIVLPVTPGTHLGWIVKHEEVFCYSPLICHLFWSCDVCDSWREEEERPLHSIQELICKSQLMGTLWAEFHSARTRGKAADL